MQRASIDDVFKKYTRLSKDRRCFIIDVRQYKDWKRRHLLLSYCIRLSSNGKALVDYSKNRYDQKWAQVIVCFAVMFVVFWVHVLLWRVSGVELIKHCGSIS